MDAVKQVQLGKLQEQKAAAMVKMDRALQELEKYGGQRIKPLDEVANLLDIEMLKSIAFDLEAAVGAYQKAQRELGRLVE